MCKYYYSKSKDEQMLYLTSFKLAADILKAKFSKYLTASSYSTYLPEKGFLKMVLFFLQSFPNGKNCKLGTKKFLPFLLTFFHQLKAYYHRNTCSERLLLSFFIFYMSYNQVVLCNSYYFNKLIPLLGMTPNCVNTISKHGKRL